MSNQTREWVGGRYSIGKFDAVIWYEPETDVLVALTALDPEASVTFGDTLVEAMENPGYGPPRRPTHIRVATQELADAVRAAVGDEIPVKVGAVPELDSVIEELVDIDSDSRPPSYLTGGITPAAMSKLFNAASTFYQTKPWEHVIEEQLVRIDIPAMRVDGSCMSIIGEAGESLGFLLFPSIEDFEKFVEPVPNTPADPDRYMLSLSFDARKDVPTAMLDEIRANRWPLAGSTAYPNLLSVDASRERRDMTERDVLILAAAADAFVQFFRKHAALFDAGDSDPVRETYSVRGVDVTVTAPYD